MWSRLPQLFLATGLYATAESEVGADTPVLSTVHPVDVPRGMVGDQEEHDLFSWKSFVALNAAPPVAALPGETGDNEAFVVHLDGGFSGACGRWPDTAALGVRRCSCPQLVRQYRPQAGPTA